MCRSGEAELGGQAIIDRDDQCHGITADRASDVVVGVEAADHPPTAVEEHHDGMRSGTGRCVDAGADRGSTYRDRDVTNRPDRDGVTGQLHHVLGARAGLLDRLLGNRWFAEGRYLGQQVFYLTIDRHGFLLVRVDADNVFDDTVIAEAAAIPVQPRPGCRPR